MLRFADEPPFAPSFAEVGVVGDEAAFVEDRLDHRQRAGHVPLGDEVGVVAADPGARGADRLLQVAGALEERRRRVREAEAPEGLRLRDLVLDLEHAGEGRDGERRSDAVPVASEDRELLLGREQDVLRLEDLERGLEPALGVLAERGDLWMRATCLVKPARPRRVGATTSTR